jgi:phage-related protein (TIGR01555 family)
MDDTKQNSLTGLVTSLASSTAELSSTNTTMYSLRFSTITNNRSLLSSLYAENGFAQTVIDIPVDDGFRGGLDISCPEFSQADILRLQDYLDDAGVLQSFAQMIKWGRLFGGSGLVMNAGQNRLLPLNPDKIKMTTPLEFYAVDRWELSAPLTGNSLDQFKPMFKSDDPFNYYGHPLHQSHVLIFRGKEAPSMIRAQFLGWGMSELERMIRSFNMYQKHGNVVFELLDESKIDVFGIQGMNSALASAGGTAKIAERVQLAAQMKNYQSAMAMDTEDTYAQKQLSYSGLSEILEQIRIGVASDCRMPLTKLFGLTPSGLSATSDDIENYNCFVESEIRMKSRPLLRKLLGVCCQKVFGYQPQTLKFRFQPLREMTTEQHSSILTQRMNRILAAFQNGVITEKTAAEQINAENIFSQPIPVNEALSLDEVHEIRQSKPAPTTPGYGAGTSVVTT